MLKPDELRLGNYLRRKHSDSIVQVEPYMLTYTELINYEPVTLTPDRLNDLGFIKMGVEMSGCEVWSVPDSDWRVARSYRDENCYKLWHTQVSPPTWRLAEFNYLHELQNIIFSLTKREIKL